MLRTQISLWCVAISFRQQQTVTLWTVSLTLRVIWWLVFPRHTTVVHHRVLIKYQESVTAQTRWNLAPPLWSMISRLKARVAVAQCPYEEGISESFFFFFFGHALRNFLLFYYYLNRLKKSVFVNFDLLWTWSSPISLIVLQLISFSPVWNVTKE